MITFIQAMRDPIIEVEHINKLFIPPLSYRDILTFNLRKKPGVLAIDDISFNIPGGKTVCILGPNGAGKTTLLKILSTLILPDNGTVTIGSRFVVGRDDEKIKTLVGLVLGQERTFYWRLTGRQNLQFFAALYGLDNKQTRHRLKRLFDNFEIDYADKRFDSYSSGMKQKFSLIRALLHEPPILLLDEPTRSLDITTAHTFRKFIKEKLTDKAGRAVIFTTHSIQEAESLGDIFLILHKGKIKAQGTLKVLREQVNNPNATLQEILITACS